MRFVKDPAYAFIAFALLFIIACFSSSTPAWVQTILFSSSAVTAAWFWTALFTLYRRGK